MERTKVVINIAGGVLQEVSANTKEIDVILVDFDSEDSEELSALYVEEVLENPNMFQINLQSLQEDVYYAECGICEREERIRLNETDWLPTAYLDEEGEIGPVCPECQQRWIQHDNDGNPIIRSSDITLDQIHLVPNLLKTIQGINLNKERSIAESVVVTEEPAQRPKTFGDLLREQADLDNIERNRKDIWFRKFYTNMVNEMILSGYFSDIEEAHACLVYYENIDGNPAIIKTAGGFEMLGNDVCIDLDRNKYITIESPDNDYYVEVENAECLRCYSAKI